ncbi:MAG: T9SS type A sorting domain-containing protein, partial [Marinilabiliaceae bacterium]|nr:T9SS type A sorting domain-containing protein [Marinilabiliaceae bacterium]
KSIVPSDIGEHQIKIWVSLPDKNFVENTRNSGTFQFLIYRDETAVFRTNLIEVFTSSSCPPCKPSNEALKALLDVYKGRYSLIKNQMSWPGNGDPYYTLEGNVRRTFYAVNAVPDIYLNGSKSSISAQTLNNALQNPAFMEIEIDYTVVGQTVDATVTVTPTIDMSNSNLRLYIAIVERETENNRITNPNQSNGETKFYQVMKKYMPDASGIVVGELNANQPQIFNQQWTFQGDYRKPDNSLNPINHATEHSVEDFDNLTIVAWVQNITTREVLQSCYPPPYSVTYETASEGGTITATVNGVTVEQGEILQPGTEITFTATPDEWFAVKEWKNGEVIVPDFTGNEYVTTVDRSLNVSVEYYTSHSIVNFGTHNNQEFGTISATVNGVVIESDMLIPNGSEVIFTATPNEYYEVRAWRLNGAIVAVGTDTYIIDPLSDDITVTVEFQATHFNVQFGAVCDIGTVTAVVGVDPETDEIESNEYVLKGKRVVFTATPCEYCIDVKEWRNNGTLIGGNTSNTYVINSLSNHANVTVEYYVTHYKVNFSKINEFGTLTAAVGGVPIDSGDFVVIDSQIVFTAVPDAGYMVKEWKLNGTVVPSSFNTNGFIHTITQSCDEITVEFIAADYTVSGLVTYNSVPLEGVTIAHSDGFSVSTNVNGEYNLPLTENTTVTITPTMPGYMFSPPSIILYNVSNNYSNQNFTAIKIYSISGTITNNGIPLAGVTMITTSGTPTTTNSDGEYVVLLTENDNNSLTITPDLSGYAFVPPEIIYYGVSNNIPNQNYSAFLLPIIITNTLTNGIVGEVYSESLLSIGDDVISWSFENGILPNGLSMSLDGIISGMPSVAGTFSFTAKATNNWGNDTKDFTIVIAKGTPVYTIPDGLMATYGNYLSQIELETGWSWETPSNFVGEVGLRTHKAVFTPSDTDNYNIVEDIYLQIIVASLEITITVTAGQSKIYGENDPEFEYSYTPDLVGTDSFSGTLSREAGENAGIYAINQGTLTINSNYSLTFLGNIFEIIAKPITVTVSANYSKVYGDDDPDFEYTYAPDLLGTDSFSGTLSREAGENAGIYAINQGTLTAGNNYNIIFEGADFEIIKALGALLDPPVAEEVGTTTVSIFAITPPATGQSVEYAIDLTNEVPQNSWQAETLFAGLTENTTYFIFARSAENQNYNAGAPSEPLEVKTGEVGINNISQNSKLHVYPNPTNGKFSVVSSEMSVVSIEILDIAGRLVHREPCTVNRENLEIDISHLSNGIYFVKVGNEMVKIVKN